MAKIEKVNFLNQPIFLMTKETKCPYLENKLEKRLVTDLTDNSILFDELSLSGFRRIENWMYRPSCNGCNECQSYRFNINNFVYTKSLLRVQKKNRYIKSYLKSNKASKEYFNLFQKYQKERHEGSSMSLMAYEEFKSMIEISPINTKLMEFRDLDDALIGIMLFDQQKDGLSAVYSFYNLDFKRDGIGNFMILDLLNLGKKLKLDFIYLGFYVRQALKMNYKLKFKPGELYFSGKWNKI